MSPSLSDLGLFAALVISTGDVGYVSASLLCLSAIASNDGDDASFSITSESIRPESRTIVTGRIAS